jgi:hypothetical protein
MSMEGNMLKEKIIDLETGEETWRDYTPAEIAEVEKAQADAAAKAAAEAQVKAEAAAAKAALLAKLDITEEEAKLLLS